MARSKNKVITHKHPVFRNLHIGYWLIVVLCLIIGIIILKSLRLLPGFNVTYPYEIGTAIDSLNGVEVYFNGPIANVHERNVAPDGYNIGLQWQCVEFVKRYYYEHFDHQMPDAFGNAKDFFNDKLPDASYNEKRALVQYTNPSLKKPAVDDIIVFDGHIGNRYGHIAIISNVFDDRIEIIQQNPGPDDPSRENLKLEFENGRWHVANRRCLGWLRIE